MHKSYTFFSPSSWWAWFWFYFLLENISFSWYNIFLAYRNCYTALLCMISTKILTSKWNIKICFIIHTFIAALFFNKSLISVLTHSINHNRTIMFHQNPFTPCPVENEFDHSQSNFHTVSVSPTFCYFVIVGLKWTHVAYNQSLSVSDGKSR